MDDNIIKHYSNEDTFQITMEEMGGLYKLILTEIWVETGRWLSTGGWRANDMEEQWFTHVDIQWLWTWSKM